MFSNNPATLHNQITEYLGIVQHDPDTEQQTAQEATSIMTKQEALSILEAMEEEKFQTWFKALPNRTVLLVKGGMVNWRDVLPEWYMNQANEAYHKEPHHGGCDDNYTPYYLHGFYSLHFRTLV